MHGSIVRATSGSRPLGDEERTILRNLLYAVATVEVDVDPSGDAGILVLSTPAAEVRLRLDQRETSFPATAPDQAWTERFLWGAARRVYEGWDPQPITPNRRPFIDEARTVLYDALDVRPATLRAVVALTHDVDFVHPYGVHSLHWWAKQAPWLEHAACGSLREWLRGVGVQGLRVLTPTRRTAWIRWIDLERRLDVRSTYYVHQHRSHRYDRRNGWYGYRDRVDVGGRRITVGALLRELVADGFEIGPHIGLHACDNPPAYRQAVAELTRVIGFPPLSTRHHWIGHGSRTVEAKVSAGIEIDLNYGRRGFDLGTAAPFRPWRRKGGISPPLVVPTVLMDDIVFKARHDHLNTDEAWEVYTPVVRRVAATGGIVALSFHPGDIPGVDALGFYERLLTLAREEGAVLTTAAAAGAEADERFPRLVPRPVGS